jgi:hypothetical protein
MAGAHAVQMVSALLRRGPEHLRRVRDAMAQWMEEHGYESLRQMQGSMNLKRCGNPSRWSAPTTCGSSRAGARGDGRRLVLRKTGAFASGGA